MASRGKLSVAAPVSGARPRQAEASRVAGATAGGSSRRTGKPHHQRDPLPTVDLTRPHHVPTLVYMACFRRRKFARGRFARLISERIGPADASGRFITRVPVEPLALFLSREVRIVSEDSEPLNECFELPDGGMLEFVGDHMDAAETALRLLAVHDESRLVHLVDLLRMHDRAWLHTLAIEARDARLSELGFADIDDVDRLFVRWHAPLLLRKLERTAGARSSAAAQGKMSAADVLMCLHRLREPLRTLSLERLHFLMVCQAVHDAGRKIRLMTPDNMHRSAAHALRVLARGIAMAGGNPALLAGPEVATVYRLGLTAESSEAKARRPGHLTTRK
jgi:hypothetical protein